MGLPESWGTCVASCSTSCCVCPNLWVVCKGIDLSDTQDLDRVCIPLDLATRGDERHIDIHLNTFGAGSVGGSISIPACIPPGVHWPSLFESVVVLSRLFLVTRLVSSTSDNLSEKQAVSK